jgi:nitrite reductase/ring-hydroxylating ferredoxin subunit
MLVEVARVADIADGGMISVSVEGKDIVICNYEGRFYAVSRSCGHLNAYLNSGTLDGPILTCPLHFAQFDITTGEALSGPVPPDPDPLHATADLKTYPVQVRADTISIDI